MPQLLLGYHALGQTRLATETLTHAQAIASPADLKHRAQIKAALGAIYTLASPAAKEHSLHAAIAGHEDMAEMLLKEGIKLARGEGPTGRSCRSEQFGKSLQLPRQTRRRGEGIQSCNGFGVRDPRPRISIAGVRKSCP